MGNPVKLADKVLEVIEGSGEDTFTCFLATEMLYVKYKTIVDNTPPIIKTPEEEAKIDAEVSEMLAFANANQAKVMELA